MENKYSFDDSKHLHTLGGKPLTGCSTIVGVLPKTLTWWASGLALSPFGWTKKKDEDGNWVLKELRLATAEAKRRDVAKLLGPDYLKLLDDSYAAHNTFKEKAAEAGTDRHALVENWIRSMMADNEIEPDESIMPFVTWARENVQKFLLSEAHCYSEKLWLGGIVDVACLMGDGSVAILDVKSSKEAYPNHFAQIAGYDIMLSENGAFTPNGEKITDFQYKVKQHIVFPFGATNPTAVVRYDVDQAKELFKNIVGVYRGLSNYKNAE